MSSQFVANSVERFVHNAVKRLPWLKNGLRNIYQVAMLPWLGTKVVCDRRISVRKGYYFGFHDKSPWSPDDTMVLAHRLDPGAVTVGYFVDSSLSAFRALGTTGAWSIQQGSQLQWCGEEGHIVYNCYLADGALGSMRVTPTGKKIAVYERPISSVDSQGRFACVIDYCAFGKGMPGYGYERAEASDREIGLVELDMETGGTVEHADLAALLDLVGWRGEPEWHSFVSHHQYSPSGEKVAFFVRRYRPGLRLETRMCVFSRLTGSVRAVSATSMVSHYCWLSDRRLLVYLEVEPGRDAFRVINADSGEMRMQSGLPVFDGHPNYSLNSGLVVIDAYPDRRRRQKLMVFRYDGSAGFELQESMSFYSPLGFRDKNRVDLHPRWDRAGQRLCIDCSFSGQKSIAVLH